jgi:hypothetical protein
MKKIVKKYRLHEQPGDREFWLSQPPSARLAAVTQLVNQYYGLDDESPKRLQRILTITKRPLR